jgi:sugar phosphate isomerase/epimerase
MDRRLFVQTIGATGAAAMLPRAVGAGWRPALSAADHIDKVGLQLYTVRNLMQVSVEKTLAEVAQIGYKEVEFAGYFGRPPRAVKQLLDDNGLDSPSAHIGMDAIRGLWSRTCADAAEIDQKYLVVASVPDSDMASVDAIKRLADVLHKAADDAREYHIKLAYHNHDAEFVQLDGRPKYDILLEQTGPDWLQMEMDIYWITKGGGDPLYYWSRWPDRFPMVHVKDAGPAPQYKMEDVGKGTIDWVKLFSHHKEAGIKHYFVEHDNPPNPLADIKVSYEYLKNLEF